MQFIHNRIVPRELYAREEHSLLYSFLFLVPFCLYTLFYTNKHKSQQRTSSLRQKRTRYLVHSTYVLRAFGRGLEFHTIKGVEEKIATRLGGLPCVLGTGSWRVLWVHRGVQP